MHGQCEFMCATAGVAVHGYTVAGALPNLQKKDEIGSVHDEPQRRIGEGDIADLALQVARARNRRNVCVVHATCAMCA